MQEAPTLRPLGVGDIIDRTFTLVRERWLAFIVLAAVPQLVFSIVSRLAGFADPQSFDELAEALQPTSLAAPDIPPDALASVGRIALVLGLIAVVIFVIQAGALVELSAARYLGRDMTIGDAASRAVRAGPRLIVAGVVAFLGLVGAVLAAILAVALVALLAVSTLGGALGGVLAALLALGAVVGVPAVMGFVSASWLVAPVAVMIEGAGPMTSLRRSWQLAHRARWRILALVLLVFVLQIVLSALFSVLFLAAFVAEPLARAVLQEAANVGAVAVTASIQWGAFTILYYDLRVRREALDLQLAAEQLSREP